MTLIASLKTILCIYYAGKLVVIWILMKNKTLKIQYLAQEHKVIPDAQIFELYSLQKLKTNPAVLYQI